MKHSRIYRVVLCLSAISLLVLAAPASASLITPDPSLPPADGVYVTAADVHATYVVPGLGTVVLGDIQHTGFTNITHINVPPTDEREEFDSIFAGMASVDGGAAFPILGSGPVKTLVHGKLGVITGTFQTEMLQLDLTGTTPLGPAMIRESPTLVSPGQTIVTDIGGGLYNIDSFFDLFTELSTDGGQTWIPAQSSTRVVLVPEPATLSVAGLVALTLLVRRRSRA